MKKKKLLVTGLAVALAAAMMFGGTLAYLTDSTEAVENDFATNQNSVDLKETTDGYDIVPGTEQEKDPTVTATYTLDSYVYVVVTDATDGLVTYSIENGWILMSEETDEETGVTTYIYYQLLTADEDENTTVLSVLAGNTVSYSSSLTNKDLENAEDISLTFQAYIIQAEPFADAENAWLVLNGKGIWINSTTGVVYTDACDGSTCGFVTALTEAEDGDTITLLVESYTCSTQTAVTTDVTIDLDGGTLELTYSSASALGFNDGAVVVIENGTINCVRGFSVQGDADVTLSNLSITSSSTSGQTISMVDGTLTVNGDATITGNYVTIVSAATDADYEVTINVYGSIISNASQVFNSNRTYAGTETINIYDGALIQAENSVGIYHPENGTINMYGGTVTGVTGIIMGGGTLNMYGGQIISTVEGANADGYGQLDASYGNAGYLDGSAIIVAPYTNYVGGGNDTSNEALHVHVNIYGGTVSSASAYAIRAYKITSTSPTAATTTAGNTITISGDATLSGASIEQYWSSSEYAIWSTPDYILIPATMNDLLTLTIDGTVYTGATAD